MKPLKQLTLVLALGALAAIYWQAQRPARPQLASTPPAPPAEQTPAHADASPLVPAETEATAPRTTIVEVPSTTPAPAITSLTVQDRSNRGAKLTIPVGAPIPELFPFQAERDTLQQLASTYDTTQIPTIAGYLRHSDRRVRDSAINSLVQLGDASAIPYLESAAQTAEPEEKKRIQEAVTFLKLPSFLDVVAFAKPNQAPPASATPATPAF